MWDLAKRVAEQYNITEGQAISIIRLLQHPDSADNNFWEVMKEIVEKRIKGDSIL